MPGLRRLRGVSRGVGSKISGALAAARDEVVDALPGQPDEPTPDHTGDAPASAGQEDPVPVAESASAEDETAQPDSAQDVAASEKPDAVAAAAVDLARAVAVEVAGDAVGEHLGVEAEPSADGYAVTHSFATLEPGYSGWRWAVTVARGEGLDDVTVDEVVLLPGSGALVAPAWVPWDQRLQPGDLGPGDLLPPAEDDPRLVRSYEDSHPSGDAEELPFDLHRDLGLGRSRVLSVDGRADAAERWYDGETGPGAPIAKQAPGRCVDCGFLVPLAGALGRGFGACANAMAPDDGRVVALLHGCGAHSEQPVPSNSLVSTGMALEHEEMELVDVAALPEPADAED